MLIIPDTLSLNTLAGYTAEMFVAGIAGGASRQDTRVRFRPVDTKPAMGGGPDATIFPALERASAFPRTIRSAGRACRKHSGRPAVTNDISSV